MQLKKYFICSDNLLFLYEWNQSTFFPFNNMAFISMALPATYAKCTKRNGLGSKSKVSFFFLKRIK